MDAGSARRRLTALANHTRDGPAASSALPPLRYRCLVQDPVDGPSATPGGRRWFCPHAATGNYEGGFDAADADVDAIAAAVHEDGYAVVRGGLPVSFVEECAVAFALRLESHVTRIGENDPKTRNRGPYRHYIDLPAVLPFARVVSAPLVAAIVHRLLGPHAAADRLASDTPLGVGSVYQAVHLDVAQVCLCVCVCVCLCVCARARARVCVALSISRSFHTY